MRASTTSVIVSSLLSLAAATPVARSASGCAVTWDKIPLPLNQTTLTVPSGVEPIYVAAGFGTQNYTCSSSGTYTSVGAIAELFDASCIFDVFPPVSTDALIAIEVANLALGFKPLVLGRHYFVNNPLANGTGIDATFDFRADSQKGNSTAFVITTKIGDLPSPRDNATNVDWLELQAIPGQGDLAKYVFRIDTLGGQPPLSCTPGSPEITVPYSANYWFFG